jgi:hypothetical protein
MLKTIFETIIAYFYWFLLIIKIKFLRTEATTSQINNSYLLFSNFPPESGGGVFRPHSWVKYSDLYPSNTMNVITKSCSEKNFSKTNALLLSEIPEDVMITFVENNLQTSYKLFPEVSGTFSSVIFMALKAIKLYQKSPPRVIIASGPDFNYFVAAYYTSLYFKVPLIIDYRDEWSLCPFDFVSKTPQDHKWEKIIQAHASQILFTTQSQLTRNSEHFGQEYLSKSVVIYNGWDDSNLKKSTTLIQKETNSINICFFGNFAAHSAPEILFEEMLLLTQTLNLTISLIGTIAEDAEHLIRKYKKHMQINIYPQVPINEVLSIMNQESVDFLILISNKKLKNYLPGKIFYYLASKKPILIYGSKGESQRLVESMGAGVFCPTGDIQLLEQFILSIKTKKIVPICKLRTTKINEMTRKNLALKVFNILNKY